MKQITLVAFLVLGCSVAAACQERGRLEPLASGGHQEMGREYIPLENNDIRIELGFDGIFDDFFVFDVVVINGTSRPLATDPASFYYVILDSADAESSPLPPFRAKEPDRILSLYHEFTESGESTLELNTIIGFVEGGIHLITGATAFLTTEDPACIVEAVFSSAGTAGHYVARGIAIRMDVDEIRNEEEVVRKEILRPGEIPPGKVLSGYVFFPKYDEPGFLMFCIPVEDQVFQFVYRQ